MSISAQVSHHHRSTTKQDHKSFKSRHATKSALKDAAKGKIENEDRGKRRTPHQQVMSKLVRKNQAKQARLTHKAKKEQDLDIFKGVDGAPKHVAVIPLSTDVNVQEVIRSINASVDIDSTVDSQGNVRVRVERYGRNVLFIPSTTDFVQAMDVCKLADLVILVMAADKDIGDEAHTLLKVIEGQGVTTVHFAVQCTQGAIPDNKLHKRLAELKSEAEHYFPILDKMSVIENKNDCSLLMRKICTSTTKGIVWRDSRSWMHIDGIQWLSTVEGMDSTNVVLKGVVRGKSLNPDRLVYVNGWGEYQVERITQIAKKAHKRKADEMAMDEDRTELKPSSDQDDLAELAPEPFGAEDDVMTTTTQTGQKGVLLDDHHYFSDDNSHIPDRPAKLPAGTSDYQSAWYLEDVSDSEDEMMEDDMPAEPPVDEANTQNPEDGAFISKDDAMTDIPATDYPESEMHIDQDEEEEAKQLAEFRQSRKTEAEEDLEFPDEIELPPNVLARERLAKYRGLKSLRTSEWNTAEDAPYEPSDFKRLLQVPDYRKSYNTAMKESLTGGVPAGTHVEVELRRVSIRFQTLQPPTAMYSLLRHEHKQSIINLTITLDSTQESPLRSKDELIVQIGFRRLSISPIYSATGNTPNNVHKFARYLHPGQTATATFIGPLTWGSIPVLVFKPQPSSSSVTTPPPLLIAHATLTPPSTTTSHIIAKRIILTGHPYKIHKKLVTIRYMFFNREDVEWFKALPLWTKRGRQGFIKEALGTHGYFKATFDGNGRVNGMDAVGVSLYKRVWPRAGRVLGL